MTPAEAAWLATALALSMGSAAAVAPTATWPGPERHGQHSGESDLVVTVTGLESDEGDVRIALFDRAEAFTDEPVSVAVVRPAGRSATWAVRVRRGTYAVAVIHDSDGDGELDTNFLGMPREDYGFSNGARGAFGPPSFEDASFTVDRPTVTVPVEVR